MRDKPRLIYPVDAALPELKVGQIRYGKRPPPLSQMLAEGRSLNRTALKAEFQAEIAAFVDAIDSIHALAAFHSWTFDGFAYAEPHEAHSILFVCFHKTLISLYAAHELTIDGLYGIARPHLRQAFEALMIAKFCATDPQSDVFDKWVDGQDLYFTNAILKKLAHPQTKEFAEVWRVLCQWSHASIYASQISLDLDTTREQAGLNFALIAVFTYFTSHLLKTHILTPSLKYYARRYGQGEKDKQISAKLKVALSTLKASLGSDSLALVRDYKSKWHLK